jgi:S1-C subfamily serine protease
MRASLATVLLLSITLLGSHRTDAKTRRELISATMPAVAMVVAADAEGGRLKPIASGSGTIINKDGSVLTNYHVLNDSKAGKLHDFFVIGRFRAAHKTPEFVCAGRPSRGHLNASMDLAMIKCEIDMSGKPFAPKAWPTIPIGKSEEVVPGEQVWVLGYPNVGGSTINVTDGVVSGWTGERGGAGSRAFMKTNAAISHGNSGGTAIDETGALIGVPTAFRLSTEKSGAAVATVGKIGLIRPVEHARKLIALAQSGWSPKDKQVAEVTVRGQVVSAENGKAIPGAFLVVFKSGLTSKDINSDKFEDQAASWGQTNSSGMFELLRPLSPGHSYTILAKAPGFRPKIIDNGLVVAKDAPSLVTLGKAIPLSREP